MGINLKYLVSVLAVSVPVFYFSAVTLSHANPGSVFSGKCVAMANTSSFLLDLNNSENEVSWIGILDFQTSTYSSISASVDRLEQKSGRVVRKDQNFYLHNEEISGMYKMTFNPNPASSDYIVLVPSNSNNTIFFMDPVMGSVGVCQKL
jgi:hypothetical protein